MAFLTSFWDNDWPTSASIFSRTVAIWVKSRASCESRRSFAACALVAKLKSKSPMRSSPIITFMHASNCRVSASGTRVMVEVTPESTSMSMASSSFSHCRMSFSRDMDPVAIPSAAIAAASRASSHASTVRCTKTECEGPGEGVFTLAVLIRCRSYQDHLLRGIASALVEERYQLRVWHTSQQKHNSWRPEAGYNLVNFLCSPALVCHHDR